MRILDYTSEIRDLVQSALVATDRLSDLLLVGRSPDEFLRDGSGDVLIVLSQIYQLRRFAGLTPDWVEPPLDLMGDPPEVMSAVEGKERWNFQPWFAEKVTRAERAVVRCYETCAPHVQSSPRPEWRGLTASGRFPDDARRALEEARVLLGAVAGLIDSGELKIRQFAEDDAEDGT